MVEENWYGRVGIIVCLVFCMLFMPILAGYVADDAVFAAEMDISPAVNFTKPQGPVGMPDKLTTLSAAEFMQREVVVGGQSIGLLLENGGVTVVGMAPITKRDGLTACPAENAGLEVGDFIIEANGEPISEDVSFGELVDAAGKNGQEIILTVKRGNNSFKVNVKPEYCADSERYRLGMYVRDNTAGIGTLTFYEPESGIYGALGHYVAAGSSDSAATGLGSLLSSSVQQIVKGERGEPGEKVGVFTDAGLAGSIERNTTFGVFGVLGAAPQGCVYEESLPLAFADEVEIGPATMLTVTEGEIVCEYDIRIDKLLSDGREDGRGMVIEVTDPELLAVSGGIVQGMSGSPIVQNGKLIGAVTHVFVKDPECGYACFAEWMVDEICG